MVQLIQTTEELKKRKVQPQYGLRANQPHKARDRFVQEGEEDHRYSNTSYSEPFCWAHVGHVPQLSTVTASITDSGSSLILVAKG